MADDRVAPLKVVAFIYEIRDQYGLLMEKTDFPMSYLHGGRGDIFPQVERALDGCAVDDAVEVTLSPDEAFGPRLPELAFTDDLDNVSPQFRHVGAEVEMRNDRGEVKKFVVTGIKNGRLTADGNHPLAGKQVTFRVTVKGIREALPREVAEGRPLDDAAGASNPTLQ